MTWTSAQGHLEGYESGKIRWELVPYTRGRGLDLGCGPVKAFPHFIGVDANGDYCKVNHALRPDLAGDCAKLDMFGDASMDFVFSSHLLEHMEDYRAALKEWWRLIRPGGALVLYLPHRDLYPKKGEPGSNPDHKHDFAPADIINAMLRVGSWDLVEDQVRNDDDEYSFFQVYVKLTGKRFHYSCQTPKPKKTCAVIRYGAFGDAIQTSSIFEGLKKQGYHVTLYTAPGAFDVLKEEPHIDRFVVQDSDQVPNIWLEDYWDYLAKRYDRFINLSESIEGTLLALPGRANHRWPHEVRHAHLNRNYVQWTHELAQVPYHGTGARFVASSFERAWAKEQRAKMGPFCVLWSLAGSAAHKAWPYMDSVIARLMIETNAHVVLVGGPECKLLEAGWDKEPRVHCTSGVWSIRQSMAFIAESDLVIGTETGVLNAAAFEPVPKIITLSHSSVENLTRDWTNTVSLVARHTPCYPCHQMHYSFKHCPRDLDLDCVACKEERCEVHTGTAKCAADIPATEMWDAIAQVINRVERQSA